MTTILGSCVAVTVFHPPSKFGVLCHAMLPSRRRGSEGGPNAFRYLDEAVHHMMVHFDSMGIARAALTIKAFGGANVLVMGANDTDGPTVGRKNIEGLFDVMEQEGLQLDAYDLGGTRARKLHFMTDTGQVFERRLSPNASVGIFRETDMLEACANGAFK